MRASGGYWGFNEASGVRWAASVGAIGGLVSLYNVQELAAGALLSPVGLPPSPAAVNLVA